MITTCTPGLFWSRFKDEHVIGTDCSTYDTTTFYSSVDTNGKEYVGQARTLNDQCGATTYSMITGVVAEMVVYHYTIRPTAEAYAELVGTIQTAYTLCQSAIDKGCSLCSLLDARDHLSFVLQSLRIGKPGAS